MSITPSPSRSSSLGRRALAVAVLLIASFVVFKIVIGFVTAIASTLAVVLAVVAIIWAIRVL
jgi:hypothetical protein